MTPTPSLNSLHSNLSLTDSLNHNFPAVLACAFFAAALALAEVPKQTPPLSDLAPFFQPPAEHASSLSKYRSPLLFDDGSEAKSPKDWKRRREEILKYWHKIMGPWPPLLEKPKIEVLEQIERENFVQRRVRIQIAPEQTCDGFVLIPKSRGPRPAVVVPFYDAESGAGLGKPHRDFGYQLTKRGFVTLSIGSPGGDARNPESGEAKCQPLSFLAYVAANCANALAQLPEVDAQRIGIVGHSYGGKWAMFASCLFERFACAVWSDPGIVFDEKRANVNYWERWYLGAEAGKERTPGIPNEKNPRTAAYKTLVEQGRDLHELHALMAPRPFFVSGGSEDPPERWAALNHSVAVNRLLGYENRVAMANRPNHEPTTESNEQIYRFFEHFLKPGQVSAR
ncbi:MAG: dienelactone hydrolase family protein [Verrucomicrobiales bacterium]